LQPCSEPKDGNVNRDGSGLPTSLAKEFMVARQSFSILGYMLKTVAGITILVAIMIAVKVYREGIAVLSTAEFHQEMVGIGGGCAGVFLALVVIALVSKLFRKFRGQASG
jgi:hypothetical protein